MLQNYGNEIEMRTDEVPTAAMRLADSSKKLVFCMSERTERTVSFINQSDQLYLMNAFLSSFLKHICC